ncbi:hypothetical protein J2X06_000025 [Lysobacter niastensis]|uniref:Uncharacterized protein n=1 Tax=Lysobacter niastensis TaxID=380629 RepID=A0ABU1W5I3_9GAMM|nr:hypothetical protein [Lysobacter niastensis]MDR7132841.1 hypothetical protein [Lysobacter niastensis]
MVVLHLLTAAAAIGWAYTSHKYDCFNIGPCVGDVDYWIRLGEFSFVAYLAWWVALLISTAVYSKRAGLALITAFAWLGAILLPPVMFFSASWLFNLGISTAEV